MTKFKNSFLFVSIRCQHHNNQSKFTQLFINISTNQPKIGMMFMVVFNLVVAHICVLLLAN